MTHALVAWQLVESSSSQHLKPPEPRLVLQLTRPTPSPVIEPPKPIEQKRVTRRVVQPVVPQIQPRPVVQPLPEPETVASGTTVAVAPELAPAPVMEPQVEPLTEAIGRVGHLNNPPPEYPPAAIRQGWEGTVLLNVFVVATGQPQQIFVSASSGRKLLDDAAMRTVRRWLFTPAMRGRIAIDGWALVPIEFKLSSD